MNKMSPSKAIGSAIAGVAVFFIVIAFIAIITSDSDKPKDNDEFASVTQTTVVTEVNEPNIIYEDDSICVEYLDIHDVDYLAGSFVKLKITNKSSTEMTFSIDDVYVNDSAVLSGIIATKSVEPGKNIIESYSMLTSDMGIEINDISKLQFVIKGKDKSYHEVYTSGKIIIKRQDGSVNSAPVAESVDPILTNEE